jgi:hypothetical protein
MFKIKVKEWDLRINPDPSIPLKFNLNIKNLSDFPHSISVSIVVLNSHIIRFMSIIFNCFTITSYKLWQPIPFK